VEDHGRESLDERGERPVGLDTLPDRPTEEGLQERRHGLGHPLLDGLGGDLDAAPLGHPGQILVGGAAFGQVAEDEGLGQGGGRELAMPLDDGHFPSDFFGHRSE